MPFSITFKKSGPVDPNLHNIVFDENICMKLISSAHIVICNFHTKSGTDQKVAGASF